MVHALGDSDTSTWLDPCVGDGAFPRALATLGVTPDRITALDLDHTPGQDDALARTLRGVDFLEWSRTTNCRFDKIIGNPPYIALNKLSRDLQGSAMAVRTSNGRPVRLGSNYWYAFVCASLTLLKPGGDFCFILPAAWDYANYAASLRDSISHHFSLFEIHRNRKPMFKSVQEGCIVIIGRGFGGSGGELVRFEHESVATLIIALQGRPLANYKSFKSIKPTVSRTDNDSICRLRDVLDIHLGGVTGDARYFLLSESHRHARELPIESVRPVLSKAHHLIAGEMTQQEWNTLLEKDERIWLFDPPPHLISHSEVRAYLELPPSLGGCRRDRYKIKNRSPWYRTPFPQCVDGFISGMTNLGPWICLNVVPRLNATNTLYTVRFHDSLSQDRKAAWALSFLTSFTRHLLQKARRVYADGLLKYEPGDLLNILLIRPRRVDGARAYYLDSIKTLLSGDIKRCQNMADAWYEL
jgi:adenine-specific DNA-methyltransferase